MDTAIYTHYIHNYKIYYLFKLLLMYIILALNKPKFLYPKPTLLITLQKLFLSSIKSLVILDLAIGSKMSELTITYFN